MSFSDRLWQSINPYYLIIAAHPFNVELEDGTLSRDRFDFYIRQDVSYLRVLAHVFALISNRAIKPHMGSLFLTFSKDAEKASDDLAALFLDSSRKHTDVHLSPACKEYSDFLQTTVTSASLEESVAAVLPCFWIYRELSKAIAKIAKGDNPYLAWINLNASQDYSLMTDKVIALVDEIASQSTAKTFGLMEAVCQRSSHFEWRFWEDAYQMRTIRSENEDVITSQDWFGINSGLDSFVFDARSTPALLV